MKYPRILAPLVAALLAGCAVPDFPENAEPTQFDGFWSGDLPSDDSGCDAIRMTAEVRGGFLIGEITEEGVKSADVWGQINPDGSWDGEIGKLGISGASSSGQFTEQSAEGVWVSKYCEGTIAIEKTGSAN